MRCESNGFTGKQCFIDAEQQYYCERCWQQCRESSDPFRLLAKASFDRFFMNFLITEARVFSIYCTASTRALLLENGDQQINSKQKNKMQRSFRDVFCFAAWYGAPQHNRTHNTHTCATTIDRCTDKKKKKNINNRTISYHQTHAERLQYWPFCEVQAVVDAHILPSFSKPQGLYTNITNRKYSKRTL